MQQTKIQDEPKVIHSFPRGENEKIQLALRPYKGRYYIDLRLWFQNTPKGPFTPTKKGISFSLEKLRELKEGVRKLDVAWQALKPNKDTAAGPYHEPRRDGLPGKSKSPRPSWT